MIPTTRQSYYIYAMIEAFKESPLLLLFIVSAIGYAIGNVSIKGTKLGVAAVLFVGLGFGALSPELKVPDVIIVLGLSIFVYTIGLSSGPGFFYTFKQRGAKDISFIISFLCFYALVTIGVHFLFGLNAATSAGLLSGSVTNTPSLAALLDFIHNSQPLDLQESLSSAVVVGYSLSYPMGVLGAMFAIAMMQKWLKVDFKAEEEILKKDYPISENICKKSIKITNPKLEGATLRTVFQHFHGRIAFGRMKNKEGQLLPNMDTVLHLDDQIVLVGSEKLLNEAIAKLGKPVEQELSFDRSIYEVRRVFVSSPDIAGEKIASLNLIAKYSTIITRVKRGDIDLLANGETVLELGDRVLIVARRDEMKKLSELFGNSYQSLSQIDLFSFGFGMALGLLLGMVTFQFPGGFTFSLGYAGGPLIVALLLGSVRRTGPIVWTLPYSANLTLRQFGLILLLAGIGIRSGHTFLQTIIGGGGGWLFLAGGLISMISAFVALFVGYKILKIPFSFLIGMVSSQPAVLDFALDRADNNLPTIGFTLMLPIGLIIKIVLVQLLFVFL
jgi:putative transport protein